MICELKYTAQYSGIYYNHFAENKCFKSNLSHTRYLKSLLKDAWNILGKRPRNTLFMKELLLLYARQHLRVTFNDV